MSKVMQRVQYGSQVIEFSLLRRERRTLEISVSPDLTVEVVAPNSASLEAIHSRVHKRASWIRKQLDYFTQFHPRTPERQYVAGETHLYLGRRYRLKLTRGLQARVALKGRFIEVHSHYPSRRDVVRRQLDDWFNDRAHEYLRKRVDACLERFPEAQRFQPRGLIIRKLNQRWGSMTRAGRLVLNRALLQASVQEIDYVITHELCHRAYHDHGKGFYELLDRVLPDWQRRKASLERRLA